MVVDYDCVFGQINGRSMYIEKKRQPTESRQTRSTLGTQRRDR